jgi:hypothetical protein
LHEVLSETLQRSRDTSWKHRHPAHNHPVHEGVFILVFDLTPEGCASNGHTILPKNGSMRIELKFEEVLVKAVSILLYREFHASIQID